MFATWTPSITPSPTCVPNMSLSTPEGLKVTTRLIVILYDSRPVETSFLELRTKEKTNDIQLFLTRIVPNLIGPGDQITIFHTGYSLYEASRVTRLYSYTNVPQLYNTPSPREALPTPTQGPPVKPGFNAVIATKTALAEKIYRAGTEAADQATYNCEITYWNTNVMSTATEWSKAVANEGMEISNQMKMDFEEHNENTMQRPYSSDELYYSELYYGLSFASIIFDADCEKYDECILIVIDDMSTREVENPDQLKIHLNGVDAYVIMPNCADIDQPECGKLKTFWNSEFKRFGVNNKVTYWNGVRIETNLFNSVIWR
jgi:hypothetical protein